MRAAELPYVGILLPHMVIDLRHSGLQSKGLAAVQRETGTQAAQQPGLLGKGLRLTVCLPPSAGVWQPPLLPGGSAAAAGGPAAAACRDWLCAPPAGWQVGGPSARSPPAVRHVTAGPGGGWQPATWQPLCSQSACPCPDNCLRMCAVTKAIEAHLATHNLKQHPGNRSPVPAGLVQQPEDISVSQESCTRDCQCLT